MRLIPVALLLSATATAGVLFVASQHDEPEAVVTTITMAPAAPAAAAAIEDDDEGDEAEESIPLERVPANVLEAAKKAVEGFVPDSAEIDKESGSPVYDIHGLVNGEAWEVEVAPDGKVMGTERDDD